MSSYGALASSYDALTADVQYRRRADYLERACRILMEHGVEPERACGYVENIGRDDTKAVTLPMEELVHTPVNMFTTVFIGNSQTKIIDGKLVTPRGYHI